MTSRLDDDHAREVRGTRAGFVTRVAAGAIDVAVALGIYIATLGAFGVVRYLFTREDLHLPRPDAWVTSVLFSVLLVAILTIAWSASGRTVGDAAVGLRVFGVRQPISWPRALLRAAIVLVTSGLSMLTIPFSKRNDALHDMVCGTTVVYEWRPRRSRALAREGP